jgi:hypothetical protein
MNLEKITITAIIFVLLSMFLLLIPSTISDSTDEFNPTYESSNTRSRAPEIDGVEPKNNNLDVPVDTWIIVVFTNDMQILPTQAAFSILPDAAGEFEWPTARTLVFKPKPNKLGSKTPYTVTIKTDAINQDGENLMANYTWSFTTGEDQNDNSGSNNNEEDWWKTWEPILTGGTIGGTAVAALVGFVSLRKKRSQLRKYISRLDDIYDKYRKDPYVCEHKLSQLKESLKVKFRRGDMVENHYLIMDKKIDDYLNTMRYRKTLTKPKIVKGPEKEIRKELEKSLQGEVKIVSIDEPGIENVETTAGEEMRSESKAYTEKSSKPPRPRIIKD